MNHSEETPNGGTMNHTGLPSLPFTDPVLIFGTVMALLLIAPLVARKLRLPEIIGLITAGIIIGPYALGILARDQTVELLGKVGLMYIMFLAGLEIDLHQVRSNRGPTLLFGLMTFIIPLVLGTVLGMVVFSMSFPVAILLASMFSSHTLLTMPGASKLGLTKHPVVTTAVGGTIVTDTLALIILAVVTSSSQGATDLSFWLRLFGFMLAYTLAMILIIPRLGRWFFKTFGSDETLEFVFVLAVTFIAGYLAYMSGLEPIIGAFLAGLTLNSLIPEKSLLMTRIHFTGDAIFIPFFMLSVGMLVDLRLFLEPGPVWIIIIGMILTALGSKWFAAKLAQVLLKLSPAEGGLLYGLTVNQAAATLAAVLVGFNLGLFDQSIISGTILMIGVTCLVGSLVTDRRGRQIALAQAQNPMTNTRIPQGAERILIPQHTKEYAREIIDLALLLHPRDKVGTILPMRVALEGAESAEEISRSEAILAHSVVRILSAGGSTHPVTTLDVNVPRGILRSLREQRVSCLLMPWDGNPPARHRVFGRTIDQTVEQAEQTVVLFRPGARLENASKCLLLIPPLAHHHPGFSTLLSLLIPLVSQADMELHLLGEPRQISAAKTFLASAKKTLKLHSHHLDQWTNLRNQLTTLVNPRTLLVALQPRREDLSWQPRLDRLPKTLAAVYPGNPLLCLIPPKKPGSTTQEDMPLTLPVNDQSEVGARAIRYLVNHPATSMKELLQAMLASVPEVPNPLRLCQDMLQISQDEPVQLVDSVVLLHSHRKEVGETTIIIGVSQTPIPLPLLDESVRIVILLLDPKDQDPAVHLQVLSRIAKKVHHPQFVPTLISAKTSDDLDRLFDR